MIETTLEHDAFVRQEVTQESASDLLWHLKACKCTLIYSMVCSDLPSLHTPHIAAKPYLITKLCTYCQCVIPCTGIYIPGVPIC